MASITFFLCFLSILAGTQAVEFTVTNNAANTPGGMKFANQIGIEHVKQTLISTTGLGFGITVRFVEYCESLRNGFVAELNKKMRSEYSENCFLELSGKTVDQLWSDYKAKHNAN